MVEDGAVRRQERLKAILNMQCRLPNAIEYGRRNKNGAVWIIKDTAQEDEITVQCAHCRKNLTVKGFWEAPISLSTCPFCDSAMQGAVGFRPDTGAGGEEE